MAFRAMRDLRCGTSVTKTYAQGEAAVRALDGVDLDVPRGELMLLMGPSGSGKTTLLSIMGCILRPTSGSVRVLGREVTGLAERDLPRVRLEHIGFVFQGFNLFPTLTAAANVALALDLKGVPRRDAPRAAPPRCSSRSASATSATPIPADLSGGQKQRVAIARALAGDPPIVLADEPTAALDTHSGHVVMELLRTLAHERGRAVVIVTHDNRMLGYADRIVHLEDGRIVEPAGRRRAILSWRQRGVAYEALNSARRRSRLAAITVVNVGACCGSAQPSASPAVAAARGRRRPRPRGPGLRRAGLRGDARQRADRRPPRARARRGEASASRPARCWR